MGISLDCAPDPPKWSNFYNCDFIICVVFLQFQNAINGLSINLANACNLTGILLAKNCVTI